MSHVHVTLITLTIFNEMTTTTIQMAYTQTETIQNVNKVGLSKAQGKLEQRIGDVFAGCAEKIDEGSSSAKFLVRCYT